MAREDVCNGIAETRSTTRIATDLKSATTEDAIVYSGPNAGMGQHTIIIFSTTRETVNMDT